MPQHDIIITEFMEDEAVADLRRDFRVHYDRTLAGKPQEIAALGADAPALIVRNATQVRGELLLLPAQRRLLLLQAGLFLRQRRLLGGHGAQLDLHRLPLALQNPEKSTVGHESPSGLDVPQSMQPFR